MVSEGPILSSYGKAHSCLRQWHAVGKEIMNGLSETPIPGGFGAAGGPNDGFHQVLHSLTKSYLRIATGWGCDPRLRCRMEELQFNVQGARSTKPLGFPRKTVQTERFAPNDTGRSKRALPQATEPFPVVPAKKQRSTITCPVSNLQK